MKWGPAFLLFLLFLTFNSPIFAEINYKQAKTIVQNLPAKKGGTVDNVLNDKAGRPVVEDLGWHAYPIESGGFRIERLLLLNETMKLIYRWEVSPDGVAVPINGKAIGITR